MAVMSLPPGESEEPTPAVAKVRKHLHVVGGHVRAKTIPPRKLDRDERRDAEEVTYPEGVERPATRGDCGQVRPCPFVSCSHHNFLDVNPETGALKLNFPHLEVWQMPPGESCSLDVADRGGVILEEVGRIFNLTRERIRQIEVSGLAKLAEEDGLGIPPERETYAAPSPRRSGCP